MQSVEIRSAVRAKQDSFTVQDERGNANAVRRLNDQRITLGPVVAVACEQANALAFPVDGKAIAIVFDFVDPIRPRRHPGPADMGQTLLYACGLDSW